MSVGWLVGLSTARSVGLFVDYLIRYFLCKRQSDCPVSPYVYLLSETRSFYGSPSAVCVNDIHSVSF